MLKSLWAGLGQGARIGLLAGVGAILALTIALATWLLRTDYEVLFANLSAADAASMTHELDQMKVPYVLAAEGTSILVDKAAVHPTRLKLMGKDLPLHGAVGFELFNNSDFGMTEFAQRVNYQRALQGEITRTILSIAEVESVRVHIAFPEEGLFKREQGHAKASITLALHHGQALRREQVKGIQRLVAAAVPGIASQDVTIINDQGVALTQDGAETGQVSSSLRLELKREIEESLSKKANSILDKAFGPGQALASVDVTLDMNQVKVTTEDVTTPSAGDNQGAAAGVVVRERETTKEAGRSGAGAEDNGSGSTTHREFDYQVGRRVEQVVSSPGAITRIHALAVVRAALNPSQTEQVRKVLASAVGVAVDRGDTVTVQGLDGLVGMVVEPASAAALNVLPARAVDLPKDTAMTSRRDAAHDAPTSMTVAQAIAILLIVGVIAAIWLTWNRRAGLRREPAQMTPQQRQASLAKVQSWLNQGTEPPVDRGLR